MQMQHLAGYIYPTTNMYTMQWILLTLFAWTVIQLTDRPNPAMKNNISDSAVVFMPGIISNGYNERDMAISPDGKEMYYTIIAPRNATSVIVSRSFVNNKWSNPSVPDFSGHYADLEPAFSPDGRRLYFASKRPVKKGIRKNDFDIWYVEKQGSKWSAAIHAGDEINTTANEYFPSVTHDGSIYFTAERNNTGSEDIYKCEWKGGKYSEAISIGGGVNSKQGEFNAYVDPSEKYIIFSSERPGDMGRGDLYISFKREDGSWGEAKNMGPLINSARLDYCPFVRNGLFYFTSERLAPNYPGNEKVSYSGFIQKVNDWGNGWGDIYVSGIRLDDFQ